MRADRGDAGRREGLQGPTSRWMRPAGACACARAGAGTDEAGRGGMTAGAGERAESGPTLASPAWVTVRGMPEEGGGPWILRTSGMTGVPNCGVTSRSPKPCTAGPDPPRGPWP